MSQLKMDEDTDIVKRLWCLYNQQLIIWPKQSAGAECEVVGRLAPPLLTTLDQQKELTKFPSDSTTEVQSLSSELLRFVKIRVIRRLLEDQGKFEPAAYMGSRAREVERELLMEHEDTEFTDFSGKVRAYDG